MYAPPLRPADPGPSLVRKKRFWLKSLWFSLVATLLPLPAGALIAAMVIPGEPGTGPWNDAAVDALHYSMIAAFLLTTAGILLSALGLVWLVVSLIRYFTLPKEGL
jgi:hypothetical protein